MGYRESFLKTSHKTFKEFIDKVREYDGKYADILKAQPEFISRDRTFSEMMLDEFISSFVGILINIKDEDIPADHFALLLSEKHRENVGREDARKKFLEMKNQQIISKMLERHNRVQDNQKEDTLPDFIKLLEDHEEESEMFDWLTTVWPKIINLVSKLTCSDSSIAADMAGVTMAQDYYDSLRIHLQNRKMISRTNGKSIAVIDESTDNVQQNDQKEIQKSNSTKSGTRDLSKCKAKVHMADDLGAIEEEMSRLIGMDYPKAQIKAIESRVRHTRLMNEAGLAPKRNREQLEHYVFKGNPGTGKTTFARLVGKLYKDAGLLESGHVIEVERSDLVGEYIGHTGPKTKELVQHALGGVLFIDEAYTLHGGGDNDFGPEAMATILKNMEINKGNIVVVMAGYPAEMDQLIDTNPGLSSRFKYKMDFADFREDELMEIFDNNLDENNLTITRKAREIVKELLIRERTREPKNFGNARAVENVVDVLKDNLATNLDKSGKLSQLFEAQNNGGLSEENKRKLTRIGIQEVRQIETMMQKKKESKRVIGFNTAHNKPSSAPTIQIA
jgi:stage V sporulation protein K